MVFGNTSFLIPLSILISHSSVKVKNLGCPKIEIHSSLTQSSYLLPEEPWEESRDFSFEDQSLGNRIRHKKIFEAAWALTQWADWITWKIDLIFSGNKPKSGKLKGWWPTIYEPYSELRKLAESLVLQYTPNNKRNAERHHLLSFILLFTFLSPLVPVLLPVISC